MRTQKRMPRFLAWLAALTLAFSQAALPLALAAGAGDTVNPYEYYHFAPVDEENAGDEDAYHWLYNGRSWL